MRVLRCWWRKGTAAWCPSDSLGSTQATGARAKRLEGKEAKLCLVHAAGRAAPVYGGTLTGGVAGTGQEIFHCAVAAGFGQASRVHALGDGAPWIAEQIEERFGVQGRYLVDFYPVCEYLASAAAAIGGSRQPEAWLSEQKERLKTNQADAVLDELAVHREPENVPDNEAPVRVCHRYLTNRRDQLDYQGALAQGLPIGSGEIESAHRYIVQARLKHPGA